MSVETSAPSHSGEGAQHHPGGHQSHAKPGPGDWAKKHKGLAIAGGGLVMVLLLSHKGSKSGGGSGTDAATAAQDAAAAQQAIDSAIAGQNGAGTFDPSGGAASNPNVGGELPVTTGGAAGDPSNPTGGATEPAGTTPQNPTGIISTASADKSKPGATAKSHTKDKRTEKQKGHGKASNHTEKAKTDPRSHNGTTVHGRHFAGATGHTIGNSHHDSSGTHTVVKIHKGGSTETHISHNGGQSWTNHAAGANPPSRSTPQGSATHHVQSGPARLTPAARKRLATPHRAA